MDRDRELEVGAFEGTYKDLYDNNGSYELKNLCQAYQAKLLKLKRDMKSGRSQRIKENMARFHAVMLQDPALSIDLIVRLSIQHAEAHEEAYENYMRMHLQLPDDVTQLSECIDFFETIVGHPDDEAAKNIFKHARRIVSLVASRLGFTR